MLPYWLKVWRRASVSTPHERLPTKLAARQRVESITHRAECIAQLAE